jgi:hypothetical protein
MLGDLIDIRTKTLAILSLSLHDWYKQKRVVRTSSALDAPVREAPLALMHFLGILSHVV